MLRDQTGLSLGASLIGPDMLRQPQPPKIPSRCDLEIWLEPMGDSRAVLREIKPIAALEQFIALDIAERAEDRCLCCSLMFVGREPNAEQQILSLLRRISAKTRWLRVERCGVLSAQADDEADELDWDRLGRRMLP